MLPPNTAPSLMPHAGISASEPTAFSSQPSPPGGISRPPTASTLLFPLPATLYSSRLPVPSQTLPSHTHLHTFLCTHTHGLHTHPAGTDPRTRTPRPRSPPAISQRSTGFYSTLDLFTKLSLSTGLFLPQLLASKFGLTQFIKHKEKDLKTHRSEHGRARQEGRGFLTTLAEPAGPCRLAAQRVPAPGNSTQGRPSTSSPLGWPPHTWGRAISRPNISRKAQKSLSQRESQAGSICVCACACV